MMKGFSLIEVMIAILILGILIPGVFLLFKSTGDTYAAGSVGAGLNAEARDILERASIDLSNSGVGTFLPAFPNGSPTLTFSRNIGYANGAILFGDPVGYAFQYAPGEMDNGLDDNGDGRVDEGVLLWTEDGVTTTISRNLAENGIRFTQTGNLVRVDLALLRLDENGRVIRHDAAITVQIRN